LRNGALGHSSLESIGDNKTQPHLRCAVWSLNRPENSKTPDRFLDRFFSPPQHPPNRSPTPRSGGVTQCRAIVPNGSARRVSVGVFRLFGFFCLTGRGGILVPIDWGQSIYHADAQAAASHSVEPLSPMAPPDAQAAASFGCSAFLSYCLRWLPGSDRLGTIDLPCRRTAAASYSVEPLFPMAPRRRASVGFLCLFGFFVLLVAVASRFRSIGDNRSTMPITCRCRIG
jgi:hypothetical protein